MPPSPSWIDPELIDGLLAPRSRSRRRPATPPGGAAASPGAEAPPRGAAKASAVAAPPEAQAAPPRLHAREGAPAIGTLVHRVQLLARWLRMVLEERPHQVVDEDGLTLLHHEMPARSNLSVQAERAALSLRRLVGESPVRSIRVVADGGRSLTAVWFSTPQGRVGLAVLDLELDEALGREIQIALEEVFGRP